MHQLAGTDRTHVLGVTTVYDLPWGKGGLFFTSPPPIVETFINHWTLSSVISAQSGTPVGVNTGWWYTCSHSFLPDHGTSVGQGRWFYADKSCWQSIPSWGLMNLNGTTNQVRNPTITNADLSLSKTTPIFERANFTIRLDAFNTVLFGGPDTNPGDPAPNFTQGAGWSGFGTVGPTQQNFPRILQVSGKITF